MALLPTLTEANIGVGNRGAATPSRVIGLCVAFACDEGLAR